MNRLLFLLPFLLLSSLSAQAPPEGFAIVEGTVADAETGQPLVRARAILARADNLSAKDSLSATTDGEGRFAIKDVPPGRYRLFVGHSGYVPVEPGATGLDKPGAPFDIGASEAIRIPFSLTRVASIRGKVTNQYGAPLAQHMVKAFKAGYEGGERVLTEGYFTLTDERGEFELFDITPGWYFLGALPSREYSPRELATELLPWPVFYGGLTEAEATPIRLDPGTSFNAGTMTALFARTAHVRGQLIDATTGKPETDARILVGRKLRNDAAPSGQTAPVLTTGAFDLAGVTPGTYRLDVVTPSTAGSATVEVRGQDVADVKILLYPRATLRGRVQVEGREAAGAYGLRVVIYSGRPVAEATVGIDGSFEIPGIPIGNYRLALEGAPNIYLKSVSLNGEDALDQGLHLTGSGTIEVAAAVVLADVDLQIKNAQDLPVTGALAALAPESPRRGRPDLYRSAQAGADGHARFINVPPGDYRVFAWESFEGNAWQDPDILKAYESQGRLLHVGGTGVATETKLTPFWGNSPEERRDSSAPRQ